MPSHPFATTAFGDRFDIERLPLARPSAGYGVQMLDTDLLLDTVTNSFLPVRSPELKGLFASFDAAHQAASTWVNTHCQPPEEHRLAIVPAGYDHALERHILIYGVLCSHP